MTPTPPFNSDDYLPTAPSAAAPTDSDVFEHFLLGGGSELATGNPPPTIARLLGSRDFLRAEGLTESAAERSVDILIAALERSGIYVDRPFHLDGRAYYEWLRNDFLQQTVDFPVGEGWRTHFTYAELEPRSPQAMYIPVCAFLEDLLDRRDGRSAYHFAGARYDELRSHLPERTERYVAAWAAAYPQVKLRSLRPLAGQETLGDTASFRFEVDYTTVSEDDSSLVFRGEGRADLCFVDPYWEIVGLTFPGFATPT